MLFIRHQGVGFGEGSIDIKVAFGIPFYLIFCFSRYECIFLNTVFLFNFFKSRIPAFYFFPYFSFLFFLPDFARSAPNFSFREINRSVADACKLIITVVFIMFVNCIVFWCDKKLLIRRFIKSSKKTYSHRLSFCETKTPQPRARRTVEEHLWLFRFLSLPFSFLRLFVPSSFLPFSSLFLPSFRSISFSFLFSFFFLSFFSFFNFFFLFFSLSFSLSFLFLTFLFPLYSLFIYLSSSPSFSFLFLTSFLFFFFPPLFPFLCLISLFFLFTFFFCPFPFFFLFHYFLSSFFSFSCLSSLFFRSLSFSLFLFALFFTFYPFSSVIKHCSPVTETS